jgi:anti-sigma factor ChrR (cupin superfamily)
MPANEPDTAQPTVVFRELLSRTALGSLGWDQWVQPGRSGADLHVLFPAGPGQPATAFLTRLAPGAHGDLHEHLGHELMLVLDGELLEDDGSRYGVGDLVVKAPGSAHRVRSETGCTVLGVRALATRAVTPPASATPRGHRHEDRANP